MSLAAAGPGERLRELLMGLNDYSNSKILEIASFILSHNDDKHRFGHCLTRAVELPGHQEYFTPLPSLQERVPQNVLQYD